jgi:hypothetical protein
MPGDMYGSFRHRSDCRNGSGMTFGLDRVWDFFEPSRTAVQARKLF